MKGWGCPRHRACEKTSGEQTAHGTLEETKEVSVAGSWQAEAVGEGV